MVKYNPIPDPAAMDRTFRALADPTRRAILARLAENAQAEAAPPGVTVTDLAAPFLGKAAGAISLPAVSKHLRVLERAGLLTQEKNGRERRCHLQAQPLEQAHDWVAFYRNFWTQKLDALANYLESPRKSPRKSPQKSPRK